MSIINLIGLTFGFWKVLERANNEYGRKSNAAFWLCECKCGSKKIVEGTFLRNGKSKSCGCWDKFEHGFERNFEKLTFKNSNGCLEWKGVRDKDGYPRYGGKAKRVNRLIYEKYHGKIPEEMCVCHTCDNPGCVLIDHLWLGSAKENNDDKMNKGRCVQGEIHHKTKLTEIDIKEIRKLYDQGIFQIDIAKKFGINQTQVSVIVNRKNWKHVN